MELALQVKSFRKNFGKKVVHKDINFDVYRGECLGLLGGSGAGKSVILRSIIGLEKPDSGSILVDGEDITKLNEKQLVEIRKRVAYVFQNGALFDSMSVYENLAYPLREHTNLLESEIKKRIHEQLDEFGLVGNEALSPASLSGGMQKRLGLARAIIMGPDTVLYDEPTAGLDPFNTKKIQEMINKLRKRKVTSILVTHDMPTALEVCDRIAFLQDGKIQSISTIEELSGDKGNLVSRFIRGETQ